MPVGDKRTAINETFGNAFEGAPEAMAPFAEAADALYAARRIPGGDLTFDSDAYGKALHDATGGIVSFNGRNLIPPRPGMTADDVEDVLGQINDADDLAEVGNGIPMTSDGTIVPADRLFAPSGMFRSGLGGQLVSVAPGVYRVMLPGSGFLQIEGGAYFEIDLSSVLP
jgi:hypothetical protein